ncbi:MAG: hypothetical protein ICV75_04310 [Nitrospiraceae bacterium]|nr:hypothetical protein [Nitrospiraceae bacterium]
MLSTAFHRRWLVSLCLVVATCIVTLSSSGFTAEEPTPPEPPDGTSSPADTSPADTSLAGTSQDGTSPEGTSSAGTSSESTSSDGASSADSTSSDVTTAAPTEVNPSIVLKGAIWRTKPGIVFLRTPVGLLTLSSKTTLKDLRASQEVTFFVHGADVAVDIRKRTDGALVHRYLSGPLKSGDRDGKTVRRWTPEGEKSFHYGPHAKALDARHDGDLVTLEADDADTIVGLRDLQFDLQVGQLPPGDSDTHLLLSGTVSKLKSNFIFFRTPIGIVNVNAKIGIKNAKVGQVMTLHIHNRHMVADLGSAQAVAPARRFVTGPLHFATSEHSSVTLWTPDGEQIYPTDRGKVALTGLREGHPITVELNSEGSVVAFHRFK